LVYLHGEHEGGEPVIVPDVEADIGLLQQVLNHLQQKISTPSVCTVPVQ
jgi:hypothetical protein